MGDVSRESQVVGLMASGSAKLDRGAYRELLEDVGEPACLLTKPELADAVPGLRRALESRNDRRKAEALLEEWCKKGIRVVALGEPGFPARLSFIHDPPLVLFYQGVLHTRINAPGVIAIVGSRRADLANCRAAHELAKRSVEAGGCVVSGLAYGIDCQAHLGALEAYGAFPTIAVLGGGLDHIYPAPHVPLAERIVSEGGLLLSQFRPEENAYPRNFLNRNRIIAGLSDTVLVIQAAERSGSLSTARFALEEGRDVMALPGAYGDTRFAGSNNLLKQGAYLVTSFADVAAVVPGLEINAVGPEAREPLSASAQAIVQVLEHEGEVEFDDLAERFAHLPDLHACLLDLELRGILQRLPGNCLVLTRGAAG